MKKGALITFEGIDGSGKSTQAALLCKRLNAEGLTTVLLREPGGTDIGERIRAILLDNAHNDMSSVTELFLYLAARAQITTQLILPSINSGTNVIMDRYIDSTSAYQGFARGLDIDEIVRLNLVATSGLLPDCTFYVDCDPLVAFERRKGAPDRLESEGLEFMKTVREGFLRLCEIEKRRIVNVDGERSIDIIAEEVYATMMGRFHQK